MAQPLDHDSFISAADNTVKFCKVKNIAFILDLLHAFMRQNNILTRM